VQTGGGKELAEHDETKEDEPKYMEADRIDHWDGHRYACRRGRHRTKRSEEIRNVEATRRSGGRGIAGYAS